MMLNMKIPDQRGAFFMENEKNHTHGYFQGFVKGEEFCLQILRNFIEQDFFLLNLKTKKNPISVPDGKHMEMPPRKAMKQLPM